MQSVLFFPHLSSVNHFLLFLADFGPWRLHKDLIADLFVILLIGSRGLLCPTGLYVFFLGGGVKGRESARPLWSWGFVFLCLLARLDQFLSQQYLAGDFFVNILKFRSTILLNKVSLLKHRSSGLHKICHSHPQVKMQNVWSFVSIPWCLRLLRWVKLVLKSITNSDKVEDSGSCHPCVFVNVWMGLGRAVAGCYQTQEG